MPTGLTSTFHFLIPLYVLNKNLGTISSLHTEFTNMPPVYESAEYSFLTISIRTCVALVESIFGRKSSTITLQMQLSGKHPSTISHFCKQNICMFWEPLTCSVICAGKTPLLKQP
uniref:Putative pentatricopeptide repeat-containing protein At1g12700 n=1 Tax=Rhizophora mucronata TaxID=61149 RepID=A0A2P2KCW5_RHIMU